jgi:solute carrier family 25 (mitochondrial aspartate/glutamate transporter), member 12/13
MATATKVKEAVKESLLGTEDPIRLSAQSKATFANHARKDPETGELVMREAEFVNAIAPKNEDYVSQIYPLRIIHN